MTSGLTLGTSSRRRPGPTTSRRSLTVHENRERRSRRSFNARQSMLKPVVGPGLRRDDGCCWLRTNAAHIVTSEAA
jgi:hypothetical protein